MLEGNYYFIDQKFADEFLKLIFAFLKDPIEARKTNPRIISPTLSIEFYENYCFKNTSARHRRLWHGLFCLVLWLERNRRAKHPVITRVNYIRETYGEWVRFRIDELGVSRDDLIEKPDLFVHTTIEHQDEEDTETLISNNISEGLGVDKILDKQGGPPQIILQFNLNIIFTKCLSLSSDKCLLELLSPENSPQEWHLLRTLVSK
ncbi:MAG: hypothetical protein MRY81_07350 [Donghicola eburneus]|nr:hypothetical protein [Donghicola eburneus]MCI5039483.1 hypothetical protein [Donghicola eburneus]